MSGSNVVGVLARVFVDDLDGAVDFYTSLTGVAAQRFSFQDVELAWVGNFLLLAGDASVYGDRTATVLVHSLAPVIRDLASYDGAIIEGPTAGPNGRRLIARHPDGSVFEYIEEAGHPAPFIPGTPDDFTSVRRTSHSATQHHPTGH
ncbi:VOC family protein [Flexivirga aerilata]|uniref:VOC family protein n=1 Tax=Flexivirga aerilata TaxID=1656889 RepID=UPI001BB228A2|nr:hypothetical protein [Flexivirga aerilata]